MYGECSLDIDSAYKIGLCYYHGWGVKQSYKDTFKVYFDTYERVYDSEHYDCPRIDRRLGIIACRLGICYLYGLGINSDKRRALELFKIALSHDNLIAQYYISKFYRKADILPNNVIKENILVIKENLFKQYSSEFNDDLEALEMKELEEIGWGWCNLPLKLVE